MVGLFTDMQLRVVTPEVVKNRTVVVRVDFNVPISKIDGHIVVSDNSRIIESLKTIRFLQENNAKIILISHLGRPEPENTQDRAALSLKPIAKELEKLLGTQVLFVPDSIGNAAQRAISKLQSQEVILLENIRFHAQEETNDQLFAKQLAELGEVFVFDAFSTAHRAHASTVGISNFLPCYAGFALETEVEHLSKIRNHPARPLVVIIGGKKIADKIESLEHLIKKADTVLVGGGVANLFLKANGIAIGQSYTEKFPLNHAIFTDFTLTKKIITPVDVVAAPNTESSETSVISLQTDSTKNASTLSSSTSLQFLDIGPKTIELFTKHITEAAGGTIFWGGPLGVWESEQFSHGTRNIAKAITNTNCFSVVGGGDTEAAVTRYNLASGFDYISTAGGATLEFLAGTSLPALRALEEKKS